MPAMDQDKAAPYCLALRRALAANVRRLRSARGWSQEVLAFESGLHRTFVAHVERAARNISLDNIARLAVARGHDPDRPPHLRKVTETL